MCVQFQASLVNPLYFVYTVKINVFRHHHITVQLRPVSLIQYIGFMFTTLLLLFLILATSYLYKEATNHSSNAVHIYLQCSQDDKHQNMLLELFAQVKLSYCTTMWNNYMFLCLYKVYLVVKWSIIMVDWTFDKSACFIFLLYQCWSSNVAEPYVPSFWLL